MLPKNITIRPLSMADYEKAVELWSTIEGLKLNESDTPEAVESLLARNPDFSTVATDKEEIVGAVRSEEHTSELQSHSDLVCRLLLEKKKKKNFCVFTIEYSTTSNII